MDGRIRACTACPLHVTRTQAVPGYDPSPQDHGGGGGARRDRGCAGKPFVGAAVRLLTQLLEGVGLDRRDIYIANTLECELLLAC